VSAAVRNSIFAEFVLKLRVCYVSGLESVKASIIR